MSESTSVPSYPFTPAAPPAVRRVGPLAHFVSALLGLVLVPVAVLLLDYGYTSGWTRVLAQFSDGPLPARSIAALLGGMLLLLVVAASARLSGLGPTLAGVLYGVVPSVIGIVSPLRSFKVAGHLPHLYDGIGIGVTGAGSFVFPILAATLLGAGIGGRWVRR